MGFGRLVDREAENRREVALYLRTVFADAGFQSQAELAREVGVAPSAVSHWLNPNSDRGISAHNLLSIIQAAERRRRGVSAVTISDPLGERLDRIERKLDRLEQLASGRSPLGALDAEVSDAAEIVGRQLKAGQAPASTARTGKGRAATRPRAGRGN